MMKNLASVTLGALLAAGTPSALRLIARRTNTQVHWINS